MPRAEDAPDRVVERHLAAVERLDPADMAADYAEDAVLERPDRHWQGRAAIADYFATVPQRLGGGRVVFTAFDRAALEVRWRLDGGPGDGVRGRDRYRVREGRIVHQQVRLDGDADF